MLDEAGILAAETGGPVTEHDRTKMREALAVAARGGGSGEPGDCGTTLPTPNWTIWPTAVPNRARTGDHRGSK